MLKCRFKTALPAIFVLFFLNWSCTKIDTTELGQGLIPVVDNINTFDTTIDVIVNNFDTVSSECDSMRATDLHALGIINNDPYFGKTFANIYAEFKPQAFPFTFPDSLRLDSAFLVLHYSHTYGDSTLPQKVQVYRLTNPFILDSTYTSCSILPYDNFNLLGEKMYFPKDLDDSIHSVREDANNQLRIPIDTDFVRGLLDTAVLKSDSTFKEYLKGFAIVADQALGGNALSYFDITNVSSRFSIYARSTKAGNNDTLVYDFPFTQFSGQSNSIVRERGLSEITNNISHPPLGNDFIYIQTSPGSYAELTMPALAGLSNRVIHRAELIAEQVYVASPSPNDYLTPPQILYLDTKDTSTNGRYIPIPCDFTTFNQQPNFSSFGGLRTSAKDFQGNPINKYVFNISRYVQTIVTKGSNNAVLRLRAPYNIVNPSAYIDRCGQPVSSFNFTLNNIAEGRVKLYGTNNSSPQKIRLHIVYSIL